MALYALLMCACVPVPALEEGEWRDASGDTIVRLEQGGRASVSHFPVWPGGGCDLEPQYVDATGTWEMDSGVVLVRTDEPVEVDFRNPPSKLYVVRWGNGSPSWAHVAITRPCDSDAAFTVLSEDG